MNNFLWQHNYFTMQTVNIQQITPPLTQSKTHTLLLDWSNPLSCGICSTCFSFPRCVFRWLCLSSSTSADTSYILLFFHNSFRTWSCPYFLYLVWFPCRREIHRTYSKQKISAFGLFNRPNSAHHATADLLFTIVHSSLSVGRLSDISQSMDRQSFLPARYSVCPCFRDPMVTQLRSLVLHTNVCGRVLDFV